MTLGKSHRSRSEALTRDDGPRLALYEFVGVRHQAGTDPSGVDRELTSYADPDFSRYLRRAFLASAGFDADDLSKPVVGIAHTVSDYVTCHRQMPELVEAVKRGDISAQDFVTEEISLNDLPQAFERMKARSGEIKVAVRP